MVPKNQFLIILLKRISSYFYCFFSIFVLEIHPWSIPIKRSITCPLRIGRKARLQFRLLLVQQSSGIGCPKVHWTFALLQRLLGRGRSTSIRPYRACLPGRTPISQTFYKMPFRQASLASILIECRMPKRRKYCCNCIMACRSKG